MDHSIGLSASPTPNKTKDDFIHQAHEARQARELARRKDEAATKIQAFLISGHVRTKLKRETCKEFDELVKQSSFSVQNNVLHLLRRILFVCDPVKDRNILDSLLQFVLVTSSSKKDDQVALDTCLPHQTNETSQSLIEDAIKESIELSKDHISTEIETKETSTSNIQSRQLNSFVALLIEDASRNDQLFMPWVTVMERILNTCLDYLSDANSARLDSQHIDTYLQIINLFTSVESLSDMETHSYEADGDRRAILEKFSDQLLNKTLYKRKNFFQHITSLICERISRFRNDLKTSILRNYIQLVLKFLSLETMPPTYRDQHTNLPTRRDLTEILIVMLSSPGIIYNLERHSNEALKELNSQSVFKLSLNMLVEDQDFQKLTSTASVCMLANLVHLASLNEDVLISDTIPFVVLATKLLDSCQKNMLQVSSFISSGNHRLPNPNSKKKSDSKDVSFNPILGWLAREQATNIDKDIIKLQLAQLWSIKFLRILLKDLIKANENNSSNKAQSSIPKQQQLSTFTYKGNSYSHPTCDTSSPSVAAGLFRRAVDLAATSMSKTLTSPYGKTTGSSSNSGRAKLITPEANKISLVCLMLHTTLKTLTTLKQDILTGLCLHDYILSNLWTFISSLGPHNGLKALLEHLTIYSKTSAPEFHILTLFCECASHIISVLDDSELYEKQRPFCLEDLMAISTFLNNFVFRVICNNLIPLNTLDVDPIIQTTHKLLTDLYKRDCRRKFTPPGHWLIKDIKMSIFLKDLEAGKPVAKRIITMLPHIIPHKERVIIFRKLVSKDKGQYCAGPSTLITIHRSRIVEDGYQQLARMPSHALKGLIRVKFINDYGLDEAGIDQDGVFKEFLEDTIKRVFDPALNLFCSTSEQRLYPSPTSRLHEDYLSLFNFVGKMLGKAVYEGIVVDVPFATFFLSRVLGQPQSPLYSPIDELPSLDPELYKSLTYIKHYEGDVSELDLTFSIDQDFMGKIETHELETGGKSIPVTKESRVRYIHSVANFRMKTQIERQTEAFVCGFKSIVNIEWLSMFSASEFQRLISGDNTPIDLQDLRRNTKYFGGFHNNHRVVCWLWDILEKDFTSEEHKLFLKFVTSCSKPPLLGFSNLEPPFTIRCVEVSDDQDLGDTVGSVLRGFFAIRRSDPVDRLPTSSTCFNLLKLPNYQRRSTLREKLRYAIRSNPGFELS